MDFQSTIWQMKKKKAPESGKKWGSCYTSGRQDQRCSEYRVARDRLISSDLQRGNAQNKCPYPAICTLSLHYKERYFEKDM
jgi:hypothetical protein